MTPAARVAAAIGVLDDCLGGMPVEKALLRWSRASRFAGSKDRAAVRDLVFGGWRRRRSAAHAGGAETGRGIMIGWLRQHDTDPAAIFTGLNHAPALLTSEETQLPGEAAAAIRHDLPDWLWERFSRDLGADAETSAQALRDRAPVFLRVNPRRGDIDAAMDALARDGVEAVAHDEVAGALRVVSGERAVSRGEAYSEGLVELQDAASQAAMLRLPLQDGQSVLDYCAGGGGKALALAARAKIGVTAHDISAARMRDIPARAARAGVRIELAERLEGLKADLVLVDAPCSGSGTWRRDPDGKWRLTPERLADLARLQAELLDQAARHVAPGGSLAYATCSVLSEENDAQVAAFLARCPGWVQRDRMQRLPGPDGDGFFLARFQRGGA
ncbi:RsmB/NOP family class I SAM-dependent RNA methyltransferase [Limimaricola sp. G21655-S1]|uniref:RsmB/NOP family class I SAM-dependent RNA methyltransferase n=1 Tax=Limimaricola sp. G21655-S1 TaxID=3014768 RepID=UPI0022B0280C|nr:RsmB/NOP family class I SAM-dependent RNA methyltransferase [Limimaricola sp. G21655-S1]MCZ4260102.1 RsmB/NOP family class I SAM-dependent RNA methyltransferase [Limimaricola sp. G21655-S1]